MDWDDDTGSSLEKKLALSVECHGVDWKDTPVLKHPIKVMVDFQTKGDGMLLGSTVHCNYLNEMQCDAGSQGERGFCPYQTVLGAEKYRNFQELKKQSSEKQNTLVEKIELKKPQVEISLPRYTAINTRTELHFRELLRVFECAGYVWLSGKMPTTRYALWSENRENTAVEFYEDPSGHKGLMEGRCSMFERNGRTIWTPEDFYEHNHISDKVIREVNSYFNIVEGRNYNV